MRNARSARLLLWLPWLPGLLVAQPAESPPDSPSEPSGEAARPPSIQPFPWKEDTTHRFVWIRGSDKVGETRFIVRKAKVEGSQGYEIEAQRSYEAEARSQRATSSTRILENGAPVRFEESLDLTAVEGLRGHQDTTIRVADRKAHVTYVPNGKEERAARFEVDLPPAAFLFAGQAVEHWAVFAAALSSTRERSTLLLFYPDFRKTFEVEFTKKKTETLTVAGEKTVTQVYEFRSAEGQLRGSIWVAEDRRLVQVEFPDPSSKSPGLRVTLAKSE